MVSSVTASLGLAIPFEAGASVLVSTPGSRSINGAASVGTFLSQSANGASFIGFFDAQSITGAATVANWEIHLTTDTVSPHNTEFALWVKFPSLPASTTTIFDLLASGSVGYLRLCLTPGGLLKLEGAYAGASLSLDLGKGSTTLPFNSWIWCACQSYQLAGNNFGVLGQITLSGGVTPGVASASGAATAGQTLSATAAAGLGYSVSSSYANWPNTAGWELSKLVDFLPNDNNLVLSTPPTADIAANTYLHQIMMRQALGNTLDLTDSGTAAVDLTATTGTCTIVADGPYLT